MKQRAILYLYVTCYLFFLAGCRDLHHTNSSQAFRSVYNRFDHFNYPTSIYKSIDSVARLNPNLCFADKYDYYTFMCGYYHIAKGDDVGALTYSDSLLLLVTTRKNEPDNTMDRKAAAYLARGGVLFSLKKYNSALNYLYQSKVAAEEPGNKADIRADVYYTMGMVMYRKLNYSQAARYFIQAFEAGDAKQPMPFSSFYRMQEVLNNISESYMMAGMPDSALMYSARVESFLDSNQSFYNQPLLFDVARAVAEGTAGQAYLLKGDTANGVRLLRKSIAEDSRPGYDNGNALHMQLTLAQYYLDHEPQNRPTKAAATLKAIEAGLDTIHNEELQAKWNYLMSRYYDIEHDPATALVYLKQGIDYDKKTEADNKVLSETNIGSYFQALQNEYEMQLLKENNQIEQIYLIISVILSLLCGIIILLIWRHWHQSNKNIEVLTRLNKKVKRQKRKIEQALVALGTRNAEKDHILKVIAHDLRNPISAINALSKLLKDDPTLDKEQNECLDLISTASVESLELIDAIMQMGDSQQSSVINKELRNMNELVLNCVNQLKAQASSKEQDITFRQSATPQVALVNTDKIQRVVKNLLSNAIKFSHKGSAITVSVTGKEKNIIISVRDNGIGIPERFQNKVFEPFTDARRKGTEDEKTFGLGLSICKQFVEAHGGKIWFKSKENEGTSFYVKLHREEADNVMADYSEGLVPANETA